MSSVNTDLTKVLSSRYTNKWVALDEKQTKVVASGGSPSVVLEESKKKGVKTPIVTYVINDYGFLVP